MSAPTDADGPVPRQRQLIVTFDGDAPCATLRLKLTKTAAARPGSGFAVEGAALVRGAYEIVPTAAGAPTVSHVTYAL